MDLAFPEIDVAAPPPTETKTTAVAAPAPTPAALDLTKLDLTSVALAGFIESEQQLVESEKALKDVVHDLSTTTKLNEAISLRNRLVKQPRTLVGKTAEAIRAKMRKTGKDVTAREEELTAEFDRVELHITPQIEARQAEIAAEDERERVRKEAHERAIAQIAGMLDGAEEKSAERLARGIQIADGMTMDGFEEFRARAEETRTRVLVKLKELHEKAVARETAAAEATRVAAENAARALTIAQLGTIADSVAACFGKSTDEIALHIELLKATEYPEGVDATVLAAAEKALAQMGQLLATAKLMAQQAPAPAPVVEPSPVAPPVVVKVAAPAPEVAVPRWATGYSRPNGSYGQSAQPAPQPEASAPVAAPVAADAADASLETTEADARPAAPAVVMAALGNALPAHRLESVADPLLMEDIRSFVAHVLEAFDSKYPTQPKMGVEWWATTREKAEALQQQIGGAA